MNKILGLVSTSFGLIALYLVLVNWVGATKVIAEGAKGLTGIYKVLQGRD